MTDWTSNAEVLLDSLIFARLMHALLGLYVWEYLVSIGFDWDHLVGNKKFRWPLVFYFLNRYLLLFALIGIIVALDITREVNCQVLYTFNQLAGNAALGLASINLCLRTVAVWANARNIIIVLTVLVLGHWSLILQGVLLEAQWSPEAQTCIITSTKSTVLAATFIYSMVFDLVVLALNAYKLVLGNKDKRASPMSSSRLGKLLFTDGLVYFIIAFLWNLLATVFMLLDLNAVMSIIMNVPATIFNTIVACRVVRRLSNFTHQGPELFRNTTKSNSHSDVHFRSIVQSRRQGSVVMTPLDVHVQMETFTRTDDLDGESEDHMKNFKKTESVITDLDTGNEEDKTTFV